MPFFEQDDLRLHFEFLFQPDRPVLVLAPSLGADLSMWDAQAAGLSESFSLLRYDVRGHGRSSTPGGPYTVEQLGGDVLALLDHLELERVHFCGISMGGCVGQWLGAHAAERLDKLVLASTAAKIGTQEGWNERIAAVRAHGLEPLSAATMERWFTEPYRWAHHDEVERVREIFAGTDPEGYASCCAAVRDADSRSTLESITAPTLIFFGDGDPVTTGMDAGFLAAHIEDSRVEELPAAHLLNVEQAAAFNRLLTDFLKA